MKQRELDILATTFRLTRSEMVDLLIEMKYQSLLGRNKKKEVYDQTAT